MSTPQSADTGCWPNTTAGTWGWWRRWCCSARRPGALLPNNDGQEAVAPLDNEDVECHVGGHGGAVLVKDGPMAGGVKNTQAALIQPDKGSGGNEQHGPRVAVRQRVVNEGVIGDYVPGVRK